MKHFYQKGIAIVLSGLLIASLAACGGNTDNTDPTTATATIDEATRPAATSTSNATEATVKKLSEADITINETIENNADSEHAILADGNTASYSNTKVVKTGDSDSGDEAESNLTALTPTPCSVTARARPSISAIRTSRPPATARAA